MRSEHPDVELLALAENQGGAGGFHEGLKAAHAGGAEWIWLMDDDTIPEPGALEALLRAPERLGDLPHPLLLASRVLWTDGGLHPMNHPGFLRDQPERFIDSCEHGVLPLRAATFVSLLVHRRAVDAHGLPHKHYFLWSDDIEYTARILRSQTGFLATGSVVLHKTATPHTAITDGGERFYFSVRNTIYMLKGSAWAPLEKVSHTRRLVLSVPSFLRHEGFTLRAAAIVGRGVRDGLLGARQPHGPYLRP